MTAYELGFMTKCAELGVGHPQQVKTAGRGDFILKLLKQLPKSTHTIPGLAAKSPMQPAQYANLRSLANKSKNIADYARGSMGKGNPTLLADEALNAYRLMRS